MGLGRQSVLMMRKERRQSKRQSAAAALSGRGLGGRPSRRYRPKHPKMVTAKTVAVM